MAAPGRSSQRTDDGRNHREYRRARNSRELYGVLEQMAAFHPPGAALVPAADRRRSRLTREGLRRGAARLRDRALRSRRVACLSRIDESAQRHALQTPRLRGDRRDPGGLLAAARADAAHAELATPAGSGGVSLGIATRDQTELLRSPSPSVRRVVPLASKASNGVDSIFYMTKIDISLIFTHPIRWPRHPQAQPWSATSPPPCAKTCAKKWCSSRSAPGRKDDARAELTRRCR